MGKHPDYQASYDAVAGEYVRRISSELEHKPLDRELLDRFAASMADDRPASRSRKSPNEPAPDVEHQSRRAYIFARRPASD